MATPVDLVRLLRDFVANVGTNLAEPPDPFDYTSFDHRDPKCTLPVRVQGKLAHLREAEFEIITHYAKERAKVIHDYSRRGFPWSSCLDGELRELNCKEEKGLSAARERWFCELPADDQAAFDGCCLALAGSVISPQIPAEIPTCLRGAVARIALEAVRVPKKYNAKRAETERSMDVRGFSGVQHILEGLSVDEQNAKAFLWERWLRELTPEQQIDIDGRAIEGRAAQLPGDQAAATEQGAGKKAKKSTINGGARDKLISALTKYHKYADGSCMNPEPIGNNALAELAEVSTGSASNFFKSQFGEENAHAKYRALCCNKLKLIAFLKNLNREFTPDVLYGGAPIEKGEKAHDDQGQ